MVKRKVKKLLFPVFALFLMACGEEHELKIQQVEKPDADVQSVIDLTEDATYASLIYSPTKTSYLLLNTSGETSVTLEPDGDQLLIQVTQSELEKEVGVEVYAIDLDKEYERIHIYLNDEEIEIAIWSGE